MTVTTSGQSTTQPEEGKFLSVKDRIARYGNQFGTPPALPTSVSTFKPQYSSASTQQAASKWSTTPVEDKNTFRRSSDIRHLSDFRRKLSLSQPQPNEIHASAPDLFKNSSEASSSSVTPSTPMKLVDRLAAYQQAATSASSERLQPQDRLSSSPQVRHPSRDMLQSPQQESASPAKPATTTPTQSTPTKSYTPATYKAPPTPTPIPTPAKPATTSTPSSNPPPNLSKFGGTPRCQSCSKPVYLVEQVTLDGKIFHKTCLKCAHCKSTLKMGNLASMGGEYYCKPHFKQLFKVKGNYSEGFGHADPKKNWQGSGGAGAGEGGAGVAAAESASAGEDVVSRDAPAFGAADRMGVNDRVAATTPATISAPPAAVAPVSEAPASVGETLAEDAVKPDDNIANQESGRAVENDVRESRGQVAEEAPSQVIEQEDVVNVPKKERETEHEVDEGKKGERLESGNDDEGKDDEDPMNESL
ncbi:LIM domain-containing protein 2 [Rhizophlyctis rosea]|uniref:LIM domain-containing protein 2 n=1 Tax=Rhizophlyctis rosea TaxID=64517 RepID=A0AAD5SG27_9FUNG|nr:LIM domain-containing protein 2 [Rhizophlyctis rosea]